MRRRSPVRLTGARGAPTGRARAACAWRRRRRAAAAALLAALAGASGGCASSDLGAQLVDPARYAGYRCSDLVREWASLGTQEKQLRDLINKADDGGVTGKMVGVVAYRSDYEAVLERQKILKRAANEQNCEVSPVYSSDRIIR